MEKQHSRRPRRTIEEMQQIIKQWDDCYRNKDMQKEVLSKYQMKRATMIFIGSEMNRAGDFGFDFEQNKSSDYGILRKFLKQKRLGESSSK